MAEPYTINHGRVAQLLTQLGIPDVDDLVSVEISWQNWAITVVRVRRDDAGELIPCVKRLATTTTVIAIRRDDEEPTS